VEGKRKRRDIKRERRKPNEKKKNFKTRGKWEKEEKRNGEKQWERREKMGIMNEERTPMQKTGKRP
jgi:hypothetical protein